MTYDSHPLYTYIGDSVQGQAHGNGHLVAMAGFRQVGFVRRGAFAPGWAARRMTPVSRICANQLAGVNGMTAEQFGPLGFCGEAWRR